MIYIVVFVDYSFLLLFRQYKAIRVPRQFTSGLVLVYTCSKIQGGVRGLHTTLDFRAGRRVVNPAHAAKFGTSALFAIRLAIAGNAFRRASACRISTRSALALYRGRCVCLARPARSEAVA